MYLTQPWKPRFLQLWDFRRILSVPCQPLRAHFHYPAGPRLIVYLGRFPVSPHHALMHANSFSRMFFYQWRHGKRFVTLMSLRDADPSVVCKVGQGTKERTAATTTRQETAQRCQAPRVPSTALRFLA